MIQAVTGPCQLTGKQFQIFECSILFFCAESSRLCFIAISVVIHGFCHFSVLLAFGVLYRFDSFPIRFLSECIEYKITPMSDCQIYFLKVVSN